MWQLINIGTDEDPCLEYSRHVGDLHLEVYLHDSCINDGIDEGSDDSVSPPPDENDAVWSCGFRYCKAGADPVFASLDFIRSSGGPPGTVEEKKAEVLVMAKDWVWEQVAALGAVEERAEEKPATTTHSDDTICSGCNYPAPNCTCWF